MSPVQRRDLRKPSSSNRDAMGLIKTVFKKKKKKSPERSTPTLISPPTEFTKKLKISSPTLISSTTEFHLGPERIESSKESLKEEDDALPSLEEQRRRLEALKRSSIPSKRPNRPLKSRWSPPTLLFAEIINRWEVALTLVRNDDIVGGREHFQNLMIRVKNPDFTFVRSRLWANIGLLDNRRGAHAQAKEAFRAALLLDGGNALFHFLFAIEEYALDRFEEAWFAFDQCLIWMTQNHREKWASSLDEADYSSDALNFVLRKADVRSNMQRCATAKHNKGNDEVPDLGKLALRTVPAHLLFENPFSPEVEDEQRSRGPGKRQPTTSDLRPNSKPDKTTPSRHERDSKETYEPPRQRWCEHPFLSHRPRPSTSVYSRDSGFGCSPHLEAIRESSQDMPEQTYHDLFTSFWSEQSSRPLSEARPIDRNSASTRKSLMYPRKGEILHDILSEMEDEDVDNNQVTVDYFTSRTSSEQSENPQDISPASTTVSTEKLFDLEAITGEGPVIRAGPLYKGKHVNVSPPTSTHGHLSSQEPPSDGMFVPFPSPSRSRLFPDNLLEPPTSKKPKRSLFAGLKKKPKPKASSGKLRKARRASRIPRPIQQVPAQPRQERPIQPQPLRAPRPRYLTYSMMKPFDKGDGNG